MMISPQTYVAQYKNCTLEQCIAARDELIEELKEFELNPVYDREATMLPTPMTQYSVQVDYLKELCDLIAQKIAEADPDYEPEINEEETAYGRTRSWVNVGYFYNYAKWNEDKGLVADVNANLYYAQPGDIILVGNEGPAHTVIVSKVVNGHILVDSNSIDMKDYPIEAYTYTGIMLVKILGSN